MNKFLLFLVMLFYLSSVGKVKSKDILVLADKPGTYDLISFISVIDMKDEIADSAIVSGKNDHLFKTLLQNAKAGNGRETIWLKVSVVNRSLSSDWVMSFGDSNEDIRLYYKNSPDKIGIKKTGTRYPISTKEIKTGRAEFVQMTLEKDKAYDCYIKITNGSNFSKQLFDYSIKSFKIYSAGSFRSNYESTKLINLFFYGAIVTMLFYNLILALHLYSKGYFAYVLYVLLFLAFNIFSDGVLAEWFMADLPRMDHQIRILIVPAMVISFLFFGKVFLKTSFYIPRFDKLILVMMAIIALAYLPLLTGYWWIGRSYLLAVTVVAISLILYASIIVYRKGYNSAKFYLFANVMLIICSIVYILYLIPVIPHTVNNRFIEYILQLGSVFELSIFSLGLADRIKVSEKQQLQKEYEKKVFIIEKAEEMEIKVRERTEEILAQKEEIAAINEELENKVKERTKKLQKAYRDLLNLNYELDSFIYRAAHDIRGPITTIMGLCNLALQEKEFGKCHEYLVILDRFSKNTQITLNRILSVNDIKNNHIKPTQFRLSALKESVLTLLTNNPDKNKVILSFELPEDDYIYSDYSLLQLILQNLIDNSIRFRNTDNKEAPTSHTLITKEEEGIRIVVTDNGMGIEDTVKERIFDMFFRGSEYASGSGLGLYIARIASKKLNGSVELISSKRRHTVFESFLPYLKDRKKLEDYEPISAVVINSNK